MDYARAFEALRYTVSEGKFERACIKLADWIVDSDDNLDAAEKCYAVYRAFKESERKRRNGATKLRR